MREENKVEIERPLRSLSPCKMLSELSLNESTQSTIGLTDSWKPVLERFEPLQVLGQGSQGIVVSARNKVD